MKPRVQAAGLAAISLFAAALRWIALDQPLWLDELHSSWTVGGDWSSVAGRALQGNQSPLYFWGLRLAVELCGPSETVLRFPSLLAGVALIPLAWFAARRFWGNDALALWAALLVAVDRDCLFYAQEARPYAWVQLIGLLHVLCFERLLTSSGRRWRLAWILGAVLLFYLHYTAALLLVAEVGTLLVLWRLPASSVVYRPRQLAVDLSLMGVAWLPAAGHLLEINARRHLWSTYVPLSGSGRLVLGHRSEATLLLPLLAVGLAAAWNAWKLRRSGVLSLRPPLLPGRPLLRNSTRLHVPSLPPLLLVSFWTWLPRLLAVLLTVLGWPLALLRYAVVSVVAAPLFSAGCLGMLPSARLRWALAAVILVLVVTRGGLLQQFRHDGRLVGDRRENWPQAVSWLNQQAETDAPVFLCAGLLEDAALRGPQAETWRSYCGFPLAGLYRPREDLGVRPLPTHGSRRMSAQDLRSFQRHGRGWWLVRGGPHRARRVQDDALEQLGGDNLPGGPLQLGPSRSFGDLTVFQIHRQTEAQ